MIGVFPRNQLACTVSCWQGRSNDPPWRCERTQPDTLELPPLGELEGQRRKRRETLTNMVAAVDDNADQRWRRRRRLSRGERHLSGFGDAGVEGLDDAHLIKRLASETLQRNRRAPISRSIATMSLPPLEFDDMKGKHESTRPRPATTCKSGQLERLVKLLP